jgi:hypothetical protein
MDITPLHFAPSEVDRHERGFSLGCAKSTQGPAAGIVISPARAYSLPGVYAHPP